MQASQWRKDVASSASPRRTAARTALVRAAALTPRRTNIGMSIVHAERQQRKPGRSAKELREAAKEAPKDVRREVRAKTRARENRWQEQGTTEHQC